ncbi:hypothetical protein G3570_11550 [Balneolaceae bacterium YR4-1]|uniref:Uncharacterized protein n=1 Tax=Halalkalibaculum roseum TaxID=2709311 RepID=A0A6M1T136_9BACT|nr:hypothetical protein [Halalkalibaculum roseum]NGP77274.1 hypothetical protein [Halalkalibaculum roseum]
MQLSKTLAVVLGILTFLPFIGLVIMIALLIFEIVFLIFSESPVNPLLYLSYLNYLVPIISGYTLLYLTLGIFYFVHIIQNGFLDTEKKVLWITVLIILNGLAMPFYWYLYLWKSSKDVESIKAKAW